MNIRESADLLNKIQVSTKNPENTINRKHNGNSSEGKFIRKPVNNQTHKRKGLNTNKNNQMELLHTNILSSLKSDLQQLQSQMNKLNNDQQQKPVFYAKTMTNQNNTELCGNIPTLNQTLKVEQSNTGPKSLSPFQGIKKGIKSPNMKQVKFFPKQQSEQSKQSQKWKQKVKEFHFQQEIRNKNAIITQLQRRVQLIKQNYQSQLTQILRQKTEMQKNFKWKIQQLVGDKNKLKNQSVKTNCKDQQIIHLKQQLSSIKHQLQYTQAQNIQLKKYYQDCIHKLSSEITLLKLDLIESTSNNYRQIRKLNSNQQVISKINMGTSLKKMDCASSISASEVKNMQESPLCLKCQKCSKTQDIYSKYALLNEENHQLRNSIDTFFKQFKAETQHSQNIQNPQLEQQIQKKNLLIEALTNKLKHIETFVSQYHALDRKYKNSQYLLQQANEQLIKVKLKTLNAFYK